MRISSVSASSVNFYGFSDDLKRAKSILKDNGALDGYLKDGKTIIIEKIEIREDGKAKRIGQGAAVGVAGGATGTAIAKGRKDAVSPDKPSVENENEIETHDTDVADSIDNISDNAEQVSETVSETVTETAADTDLDDAADAAEGVVGLVKGFLKSVFDLD